MRKVLLAVIPGLVAPLAYANDFSSTVTMASDYLFNGVSQTYSHPALQASFDYTHDMFYAGAWTSDVDFNAEVDTEVDVYAGMNMPIGKNFSLEVGAAQYMYPGADSDLDYDYSEVYAGLTLWKNSLVKVWYSDQYYGKTTADEDGNKAWVVRLQHTLPINDTLSVKAQFNTIKHEDNPAYWYGRDGYHQGQLSAIQSWRDINFELGYSDTNIGKNSDPDETADATVFLNVSKTFSY